MRLRIDYNYRNSVVPAPFLTESLAAILNVDRETGEVFITSSLPASVELEDEGAQAALRTFPWSPYLTVRGIDQVFEHQGVLEAIRGVMEGNTDSEAYLWEVLGSEGFWVHLDAVYPLEPWQYLNARGDTLARKLPGESYKAAAKRIVSEALLDRVVLDPFITELELEDMEDIEGP